MKRRAIIKITREAIAEAFEFPEGVDIIAFQQTELDQVSERITVVIACEMGDGRLRRVAEDSPLPLVSLQHLKDRAACPSIHDIAKQAERIA